MPRCREVSIRHAELTALLSGKSRCVSSSGKTRRCAAGLPAESCGQSALYGSTGAMCCPGAACAPAGRVARATCACASAWRQRWVTRARALQERGRE